MKCPICGKEMFSVDPVYVANHSYGEPNQYLEQHVCYNCGNVIFKNFKFEEYKKVYHESKELLESKKALEKELESFLKINKDEFDKFTKLEKIRAERNALPEEKDDDAMLKDLTLKKKASKIEASFNRDFLLMYRNLKNKIQTVKEKINRFTENTKYIINFVESNHLENY